MQCHDFNKTCNVVLFKACIYKPSYTLAEVLIDPHSIKMLECLSVEASIIYKYRGHSPRTPFFRFFSYYVLDDQVLYQFRWACHVYVAVVTDGLCLDRATHPGL